MISASAAGNCNLSRCASCSISSGSAAVSPITENPLPRKPSITTSMTVRDKVERYSVTQ
jgi:hypothetical protein